MNIEQARKLKVLKPEKWMEFSDESPEDYANIRRICPVLNRSGYYKLGKFVWFETPAGAFEITDGAEMFNFSLVISNHRPPREPELKAMGVLRVAGLLPKELENALYINTIVDDIKNIRKSVHRRARNSTN